MLLPEIAQQYRKEQSWIPVPSLVLEKPTRLHDVAKSYALKNPEIVWGWIDEHYKAMLTEWQKAYLEDLFADPADYPALYEWRRTEKGR